VAIFNSSVFLKKTANTEKDDYIYIYTYINTHTHTHTHRNIRLDNNLKSVIKMLRETSYPCLVSRRSYVTLRIT
jgi:hypothetical protein